MIEAIVYEYLKNNTNIVPILASYDGSPAIFNMEAPAATDEMWDSAPQYPRIIYELSMQDDPERKTSGVLSIDFYFSSDGGLFIEDVEPVIKSAIDGCFFTDETDTIAARWRQTDPFTTPEDGSQIIGFTITFDVVAFPQQETSEPDPVQAVSGFIKDLFPECKRINADTSPGTWKTSDDTPAIYVRLQRINPGNYPGNYHVTWYNPVLQVHFLSPSLQKRMTLVKVLTEVLQQKQRIILPDGSPLMIQRLAITTAADQLKEGQMQIEATYGILRKYQEYEPMKKPRFSGLAENSTDTKVLTDNAENAFVDEANSILTT